MLRYLREHRVAVVVLALLSLVGLAACVPPPPPPSSAASADMVAKTNFVRGLSGAQELWVDAAMQANAQFHADRLAAGATQCNLWHSTEMASWYAGYAAAENVACVTGCPGNADATFNLWLNSPGHAGNLFNPVYRWTGVATACNGVLQVMVAQYRSD